MELNQTNFAQILEELRDTARLQGNMLTSGQISEAFDQWQLDDGKLALIHGDDVSFLEMYLGELNGLPPVSDGEKRAVMMSALAGDRDAQAKLVEISLPQVVEISRLYAGQGVFAEDLIGEGNVAAATAVTMLECVEDISEVESFIGKMIMDAMEELVSEDSSSRQIDENVLERVNEVNDKAKELYDSLLRKVTVKEVGSEGSSEILGGQHRVYKRFGRLIGDRNGNAAK